MDKKTAFLELKYGWVYGGSPKFHIISDVALIFHSEETNRITVHTKAIRSNAQIVTSYSQVDDLGVTQRRVIEVLDMNTRRVRPYRSDFMLSNRIVKNVIANSYTTHRVVRNFIVGLLLENRPEELVIFGGRRDILLCEKAGVRFDKIPKITDTQELLKNETNHLFSLNKIAKVIGYREDINRITSNNLEYYLPRFITRQLEPNSATQDVARAFLAHQELTHHKEHLMIRSALQLQKIEMEEAERKANPEKAEEKKQQLIKEQAASYRDRGGFRDSYRDNRGDRGDRGGFRDNYRDNRGDRGGFRDNYRDNRGDRGGFRDGYRDNRDNRDRPPRDDYRRGNDRGGFRGGGYNDNRDRGGYRDNRGGGGYNRGGGYNNDRGGYRDNRGGGYNNDRGGYRDNRGGGYNDRNDRGGFRGGYNDRNDRGDNRDNREGGYNDRNDRGGFRGGYNDRNDRDNPYINRDDRDRRPSLEDDSIIKRNEDFFKEKEEKTNEAFNFDERVFDDVPNDKNTNDDKPADDIVIEE